MTTNNSPVFRTPGAAASSPIDLLVSLTSNWKVECQKVLENLNEPIGVVLARQGDSPVHALVVESRGRVIDILGGVETLKTLDQVSVQELSALVTNPISSNKLAAVRQFIANTKDDEKMGQELYAQARSNLREAGQRGDYNRQFEIVDEIDSDVAVRGGLVGRCVKQPAADGSAHYMVTSVKGDRARVQHLNVCDGYQVAQWGPDAWIDTGFVKACIKHEESMKRAFKRKP